LRGDVDRAKEAVDQLAADRAELEARLAEDVALLRDAPEPVLEAIEVSPRKADTTVTRVALLWLPA
jgi:hypothetical protein